MSDQKCNKCGSVKPVYVDVKSREVQALESCERETEEHDEFIKSERSKDKGSARIHTCTTIPSPTVKLAAHTLCAKTCPPYAEP